MKKECIKKIPIIAYLFILESIYLLKGGMILTDDKAYDWRTVRYEGRTMSERRY